MTNVELSLVERLKALLAKAPKGPWHVAPYWTRSGTPDEIVRGQVVNSDDLCIGIIDEEQSDDPESLSPGLDLAVEAVNALPSLLARIEALEKREVELVEALKPFVRHAASFNNTDSSGVYFSVSDLRRAEAALSTLSPARMRDNKHG